MTSSQPSYRSTPRSTVRRIPKRGSHDRELIASILDEGLVCHVAFVVDGQPFVIPTAYARDGDRLLLHGSNGSRMMRHLASGAPVAVGVTHLDGLVLARSTLHHSMNYRSVVVFGRCRPVEDLEERARALDAIVEHLVPGRSAEARRATRNEVEATSVVELPLEEASAKVRTGPPSDAAADLELDIWAGVVPLTVRAGAPEPAPDLRAGLPVPPSVRRQEELRGG